jgi:outer membrane murein-binding lipoprotein Lpp
VRVLAAVLVLLSMLSGCQRGTASQELAQHRARVSTLEAENAHLRGQNSLSEAERDQLRQQVNSLATDLARLQAERAIELGGAVTLGENLVVVPKETQPGQWVAVYVRNYPVRLLPMAGIALRDSRGRNLAHITRLAAANVFLMPIPRDIEPGLYQIVIGESGPMGPGAQIDDQVPITIR